MRINPLTREVTMTEEEYHKRFADDSKMMKESLHIPETCKEIGDSFTDEFERYLSENIEFDRAGSAMDKWNKGCHLNRNDLQDFARHFAEWQKKRFEAEYELDWITDLKKDLYELGRKDMRAQMMEGVVEGEVYKNGSEYFVVSDYFSNYGIKDKQKVKLIIIPDDEQTN